MSRPRVRIVVPVSALVATALAVAGEPAPPPHEPPKPRALRAGDVFEPEKVVMFRDDFQDGRLARWNYSEDDRYRLAKVTPERIAVVDAPGLGAGRKAVRFVVERAPNSFRSEISLPHEAGFRERWYAARVLVPEDWVFDPARARDIVMQWHAIPGNGRPTNPNLAISIGNEDWHVEQAYGDPAGKKVRTNTELGPVKRGAWVSWVVHAKWSPDESGVLQIWRDGDRVVDRTGPNVYGTIGVEYTPYLKTGIYRPEWHVETDQERAAFDKVKPAATKKVIYVADVKVGSARAKYADVAPADLK
ncbi:Uncharacterized protein OS=Bacillus cereus BAG3O-1 GN=KQ1_02019 PE=4 SV=1: Polysacc_lyase [Gemmataceae bacterium]|nr:Uncharacterized protein OS=Bacillus cereus BAG3O-1 GN=KQ1_02019 PE=4 SV=1: Polysacc_lyase [Gemmataceae bacterium]VTU02582.1 Uncharacterized protein OS=Bacillus cereus BAG3O-1 GN=KQ1_02019 PE=4 SV=1: Polysacc_lyase [Gemmataceae bacterium]